MSDDQAASQIRVGVRLGGGPPPGYVWNMVMVDPVHDEAMAFLTPEQYDHIADKFRELARGEEPTSSETIDVRPVESFHEFRDKGGVLKKINVRVFFCVCHKTKTIALVGAVNKKNDGKTLDHVRILMRNRVRRFLNEHCA